MKDPTGIEGTPADVLPIAADSGAATVCPAPVKNVRPVPRHLPERAMVGQSEKWFGS
ncbi:hypothetical protein PYR71_28875 [Rhizobium sp. MC63]|uniref:Uncharacterized protein n=1 Tax=Rhizobium mulingense TaxID=3031128 RepID=A0ACC6N646_9HYPH|nr:MULTISPECIES: hypothetical protein [unclassified Rhizobium]MDF0700419.1 hypothetical protein [Rhizobium sp. MC63]MEA3521097.1 hypothetical protein [Rhizobium sp. MJ31]